MTRSSSSTAATAVRVERATRGSAITGTSKATIGNTGVSLVMSQMVTAAITPRAKAVQRDSWPSGCRLRGSIIASPLPLAVVVVPTVSVGHEAKPT